MGDSGVYRPRDWAPTACNGILYFLFFCDKALGVKVLTFSFISLQQLLQLFFFLAGHNQAVGNKFPKVLDFNTKIVLMLQ